MGRLPSIPKSHFLDIKLANGHASHSSVSSIGSVGSSSSTASSVPTVTSLHLTPRDESTRVQLQKQRLHDQHARALVTKTIPGFKTSAAFFASLRTNLRLNASPPPSPASTPNSMRASASSLPPPSPLSTPADLAMENSADNVLPVDPLSGVPELSSYLATDYGERVDGLKLVADSVAQQRQTANTTLIFNPMNLAIIIGVFSMIAQIMLTRGYDWWFVLITWAGVLMSCFATIRYATQDYLFAAEKINLEWLGDADVFVTKFGDEVIGAMVIDWISGESRQKKRKAWRGQIKGWTVARRYRGKGVGGDLLADAVKEAKRKGAEDLDFAEDHANSVSVLPSFYNGVFDKRERRHREHLLDLLETSPARGKKK